jgi:hypothetical protein
LPFAFSYLANATVEDGYKSLAATKAFLAQGSSIGCATSCDYVGMVKHWLWEFDSRIEDSSGKVLPQLVNGVPADSWHDFHTVAGPTAGDPVAMESDEFYSKDGQRPVYGPGTGYGQCWCTGSGDPQHASGDARRRCQGPAPLQSEFEHH